MSDLESQQWQRVSEHLDRVLELTQAECARYLGTLEERDSGVAVLLRQLLAARDQAGFAEFLNESPRLIPDALAEATLVGRHVGPYVIEAEVGSGGMGSVWRASREDGRFEARVAIKFVHLSCLGTGGEQRFKLEGRVLARLNHTSIARLIDAGVLDGTHPYIVMEYVDGEPIDRYCQSRALDLEARIRLFLEVLAAVSHAHSQLVVHRDLKPSNVLIGISVFAVLQMLAARTQRDFAVEQAKLANAQADLTGFVVGDTLGGVSRDVMRKRLDRARKFVTSKFRRDPLLAGRLLIDVSGRYIDIGENETAAAVIREAEDIGRRMDDPEYIAELACIRTQDLAIAGDLPAARAQLDSGLRNMQRLYEVPPS